ncbi:serine protease snake [Culex quinquefasciatus]|uniref:serine protease snake n=1 Tax=Culex quinquefasciatus TaxID=7176 RepID=UPI0018E3F9C9|nr:serine protease snake [Culex quinquefasciatus]
MAFRSVVLLLLCLELAVSQRISEQKCSTYSQLFACQQSNDNSAVQESPFPHYALLSWSNDEILKSYHFDCAGALISDRFVLTVAHCANAGTPKVVRLGANGHNYENSLDYKVDEMIVHPNFNSKRSYHDIALVKLKTSVVFSEFIKPACLWNDQSLKNSPVFAIGTGKINGTNHTKPIPLNVLDKNECRRQFVTKNFYPRGIAAEQQMCIGRSKAGNRDNCFSGDGNPVQVSAEPPGWGPQVVGLMAHGNTCSAGKSAAIYTKVAAYIDWIEKSVW